MNGIRLLQTSFQPAVLFILFLSTSSAICQISAGHVDDFQDLTVNGWMEGGVSPNPPTVLASGGPSGTDDAFLRNVSSGSNGAGGKWIMFNQTSDWTGNYLNAGVAKISMDVRNSGATEVHLRISFNGNGGGISSDSVFTIPADNIWRLIEFAIDPAHFITLNIGGDAALTLSAVNEFRILSNPQPELNGSTGTRPTTPPHWTSTSS
jgi:hypothetical protein